jgi:hypothetical protein
MPGAVGRPSFFAWFVRDPGAWSVIVANAVALAWVLRSEPLISKVLALYWLECAVVLGFGALTLTVKARWKGLGAAIALGISAGWVMFFALVVLGAMMSDEHKWTKIRAGGGGIFEGLLGPACILAAWQLFSRLGELSGGREAHQEVAQRIFLRTFAGLLPLLAGLLPGAALVSLFRLPALALAPFVLVKVLLELASLHRRSLAPVRSA